MLICQISDIHIGFDGDAPDERNSLRCRAVIAHIAKLRPRPDLVIITGDLAEHGGAPEYGRLAELVSALDMDVLLMVGNHDRRAALLEVFPDTPTAHGFVQYVCDLGSDHRLVVLDTLEEGRHGGAFCEKRAEWLNARLAEAPDSPTLIALHHPPFSVGIDWMDPRENAPWAARLRDVVVQHRQIVGMISGHVHRPIACSWAGITCVIASSVAPSLAFGLQLTSPDHPDGRPMVVCEPPAFVMHRWISTSLTSHFAFADHPATIASFDGTMSAQIRRFLAEDR